MVGGKPDSAWEKPMGHLWLKWKPAQDGFELTATPLVRGSWVIALRHSE